MAFPILPLLAGGLQAASSASSAGAANNISILNLFERRRANRKAEKIARSTRPIDARGSTIRFNSTTGAWEIVLSDDTKQIVDAETVETLASFDDAGRERKASERKDKRSIAADEQFQKDFNELIRFPQERNEKAIIGKNQQEIRRSNDKNISRATQDLARVSLRQGEGKNFQGLLRAANRQRGEDLPDALAAGRRSGQSEFQQLRAADTANAQTKLGFLQQLSDDTDKTQPRFTNINASSSGAAERALQGVLSSDARGADGISNALAQLARTSGRPINFGGLISALGQIGQDKTGLTEFQSGTLGLRERELDFKIANAKRKGTTRSAGLTAFQAASLGIRRDTLNERIRQNNAPAAIDPNLAALLAVLGKNNAQ